MEKRVGKKRLSDVCKTFISHSSLKGIIINLTKYKMLLLCCSRWLKDIKLADVQYACTVGGWWLCLSSKALNQNAQRANSGWLLEWGGGGLVNNPARH